MIYLKPNKNPACETATPSEVLLICRSRDQFSSRSNMCTFAPFKLQRGCLRVNKYDKAQLLAGWISTSPLFLGNDKLLSKTPLEAIVHVWRETSTLKGLSSGLKCCFGIVDFKCLQLDWIFTFSIALTKIFIPFISHFALWYCIRIKMILPYFSFIATDMYRFLTLRVFSEGWQFAEKPAYKFLKFIKLCAVRKLGLTVRLFKGTRNINFALQTRRIRLKGRK